MARTWTSTWVFYPTYRGYNITTFVYVGNPLKFVSQSSLWIFEKICLRNYLNFFGLETAATGTGTGSGTGTGTATATTTTTTTATTTTTTAARWIWLKHDRRVAQWCPSCWMARI